ncbi:MAG TPA: replication initiator protein A [Pedomonas sp.]|uniref:replication initiator protein A n=1 Tax=Pedomonas sp. TaxID=2976421 RepID=UPI002F40F67A
MTDDPSPYPDQEDLFLTQLSDMLLRDQRDMMERPFFSLAKKKRIKPIDYKSPDGTVWVHVSANPLYGMATIYDADILIYLGSYLMELKRRGVNDIPQTLNIKPYDLLKTIRRGVAGRDYQLLMQAFDRLQSTTVKTNIRASTRREATFSWLDSFEQITCTRTQRPLGLQVTVAKWFYDGVLADGAALAIDPEYFEITGGRERWLYRTARKHAGRQPNGFAISLPTLFDKSGAEGLYRKFKFEILKIAKANSLPSFHLEIEASQSRQNDEPILRMIHRDFVARSGPSSTPARSTKKSAPLPSPSGSARTAISEATLASLREDCPGLDLANLQSQFDVWLAAEPTRKPRNYQTAFAGWVRLYYEKNKYTLGLA